MRINPIDPIYRNSKRKKRNDQAFLGWLRTLPSAVSGGMPCVAAHYRTAANSGIACKPLYSAIPLTDAEHKLQHQIGQYNFRPREWWEKKVEFYVNEWKKITTEYPKG
jgi:hypothetical protein